MKARLTFLMVMVASLCTGIAGIVVAAPQDSPGKVAAVKMESGIRVKRITGTIRIVTPDNKVITVTRGDRLPEIPSGSKIMVLSGRAEVEADGTRAVLGERQALVVTKDATTGAVRLTAAEGSIGIIRVRSGSSTALLSGGNSVSITSNSQTNKQEIKVERGTVTVITPQGKQELTEGEQIVSDTVVNPRQEQRGGDTPVIPEPPQPKIEEASPSVPQ